MPHESNTPTTAEVRRGYALVPYDRVEPAEDAEGEFDRWLAEHDAEVAAKTLAALIEGYAQPLVVERTQMREIGAPGWLKAREIKGAERGAA